MFCKYCGSELKEDANFCLSCGHRIKDEVKKDNSVDIPKEYKPISAWGYFGYEILFSIPIVGFILLLVFSFGGTSNVNLKNFARSYFCLLILIIIIILVIAALGIYGYGVYNTINSI